MAKTPPIEVRARPGQRLGMAPARFLQDYWQKHPLLIRGAFVDFHSPLSPEDLAGLACEEMALSRLIRRDAKKDRWSVRSGPFEEKDFTTLPHKDWTVLVQDVDKWDADLAPLLDAFDFLPRWRIDDIMISYATDGGGVGAHVDQYDVFLLQGQGHRRWKISNDPQAPKEFRDDVELKLLRHFTPTHDWLLEPGDMLYLPPGVPHDGVAEGNCMTFSIGMRAPSSAELMMDMVEHLAEPLGEDLRYGDADLKPADDSGEIDAAAMQRLERALAPLRDMNAAALQQWFGSYITRYRAAQTASPPARALTQAQLLQTLDAGSRLWRHPWSRFAWMRQSRGANLFAAGKAYRCALRLAQLLCAQRSVDDSMLGALSASECEVLLNLVNDGHLVVQQVRKGRKA